MASSTFIDWLGVVMLFLFGITMIIQGHFISKGIYGYRHSEREKKKLEDTRKQVEKIFQNKWKKMKKESSIKDSENASNNLEWNICLKNLVHYTKTMKMISHEITYYGIFYF